MEEILDFEIQETGIISKALRSKGVFSFCEAVSFMSRLPYGRISDVRNLALVISENRGTFTTKHAALVKLARENNHHSVKLTLCLINMNGCNTYGTEKILLKYGLHALPEARGYLKYNDHLFDVHCNEHLENTLADSLISEIEIEPLQIGRFKEKYHKNFIKNWLQIEKLSKSWDAEAIWKIREECITLLCSEANPYAGRYK